jgi:hypothetical protein
LTRSTGQADSPLLLATIRLPPVIAPETGGGNGYIVNAGHRRRLEGNRGVTFRACLQHISQMNIPITDQQCSSNFSTPANNLMEIVEKQRSIFAERSVSASVFP